MRKLGWIAALALVGAGCDPEVEANDDAGTPEVDAGPPQLACADAAGEGLRLCDSFADNTAMGWMPEAGTWEVLDGRYVGLGPMEPDTSECGVSRMAASLRGGSDVRDVAIHVSALSRQRVDKVVVLRAADAANRIELNFRADPYGDLVVQELVDCDIVRLVDEGEVEVPHAMEQAITIEAELIGSHLTVAVDGMTVLDRELELANTGVGYQGLAVIDRSEVVFDDVWIYDR